MIQVKQEFWKYLTQKFSKNNYDKTDFNNKIPQNTRASKGRDLSNDFVKNVEQREPIKCWEFQGPHYASSV